MKNNHNVILLFFDLPAVKKENRRQYAAFVRKLKANGYVPMQESIYIKLLRDSLKVSGEMSLIESISPEEGSVMLLPMSYANFTRLKAVSGTPFDFSFFADDTFYV